TWGDWGGPSVDLQDDFNENALSLTRNNVDVRRKATMMMYGDVYEYFWADKGGFDYADFAETVTGEFRSPTGANSVKHLVGNNSDKEAGIRADMRNMSTRLGCQLRRLEDVYLIYADATMGHAGATTVAKSLEAYNAVRKRAG